MAVMGVAGVDGDAGLEGDDVTGGGRDRAAVCGCGSGLK